MKNFILVINSGSSSLKFRLYDLQLKEYGSGMAERLGLSKSFFSFSFEKENFKKITPLENHYQALVWLLKTLQKRGVELDDIVAVGHRVVHGAEEFFKPTVMNVSNLKILKAFNKLAPLHNPANISGIEACIKLLFKAKNVAVFDTAFYKTLPEQAKIYGLPYEFYTKYQIRRYGFHGISHEYVANQAAALLKKPLRNLNLISCHLGGGCSVTAIKKGQAIDTSMGLTPLEGLLMTTRSGDLDPAITFYLQREYKFSGSQLDEIYNKKSGFLGLTGFKDVRDVLLGAEYKVVGYKNDVKYTQTQKKMCDLALKIFVYRLKKYIGAYLAVLGKVDALIFTAGIGERSQIIRNLVVKNLFIHCKQSPQILVVPTNEEKMIARKVKILLKLK